MVMEASPSPQCVGREFVRQYYTLLNKAPNHLHRFYNTTSSFVHGGLDQTNKETKPAIGQKQIHQKIQQLNFRDCHAKITQVDSQATLGSGVVVQVSGELSNAGQPMRRFTQTFVLGAQAPKKYYVHNDIFRYQDFGYSDEEEGESEVVEGALIEVTEREGEEGVRSEPEEEEQQSQPQQITAPISGSEQHTVILTQPPIATGQPLYYPPPPPQHVMPPVMNGSVTDDSSLIGQQQASLPLSQQPVQAQQPQYVEPVVQEQFSQETETTSTTEAQQVTEDEHSQSAESLEPTETACLRPTAEIGQDSTLASPANTSNSGPKTYANLVKSCPSSQATLTNTQPPKISMSPPPMSSIKVEEKSPLHPSNSGPSLTSNTNVSSSQQQPHRVNANQQQSLHQPQQQRPPRSGPMQRDGDRRSGGRPNQFTDAHQLFLGNVPHHATEFDLRQLFERYGKVAELRVHSKANDRSKGPQGANSAVRVPNYGFITFEDSTVVAKVLNDLPIFFPDENGQIKLNVEEKKIKTSRMSMEGSGRSNPVDNMRSMGGQQQRGPGGLGGMRGGSRGGPRGSYSRGGDGGRTGGGMRQPGNPNNSNYANRR
ncbi:ras GTPase-activating protein-binding protein 1 isoform X2 [Leptopilina heterotoma]|uniref:ras GTPase-activating protein-binding protein 1 isoform X2 n=1 Tax=Leptopilina heterotoma TaxID=63436 RepID=UPI001CA9206B|nr:ras GTPase-activating protein-binding protein 1 isoform X2 [Leptopilina heterotoma]